MDINAHINVVLDYPEEGIDDPIPQKLLDDLKIVYDKADRLIKSYDKGKMIKDMLKLLL